MNNEVEAYVGELRFLRNRVKELEEQLKHESQQKVRVSGVPYEVDLRSQEPDRYNQKELF